MVDVTGGILTIRASSSFLRVDSRTGLSIGAQRFRHGPILQATVQHKIIGLLILGVVVEEINKTNALKNLARHRKTCAFPFFLLLNILNCSNAHVASPSSPLSAVGFRDTQLLDIYQIGFKMLEALLNRRIPFTQRASPAIPLACLAL